MIFERIATPFNEKEIVKVVSGREGNEPFPLAKSSGLA
jgi:hypothetical protein